MLRTVYLVVLVALLLPGCSSVSVTQDFDPGVNFSQYKTFAWQYPAQPQVGDPKIDNDLRDARIRNAVKDALQTKGFSEVEPENADILVAYFVTFERKLQSTSVSLGFGRGSYGRYGGAGMSTGGSEYEQGRLTLDFLRQQDKKTVWRGEGTKAVFEEKDPQKAVKAVNTAVSQILKNFPPKP